MIHTFGPVGCGGDHDVPALLATCDRSSLALAEQAGCAGVAFPSRSTGVHGDPHDAGAAVAVDTMRAFRARQLREVTFCSSGADLQC